MRENRLVAGARRGPRCGSLQRSPDTLLVRRGLVALSSRTLSPLSARAKVFFASV